jgi:hypothetical protein
LGTAVEGQSFYIQYSSDRWIAIYYTMLYQLQQRMITFGRTEGTGEGAAMAYFEVLTWHSLGEGEENQEKPQAGSSVSWLRSEPGTSYSLRQLVLFHVQHIRKMPCELPFTL